MPYSLSNHRELSINEPLYRVAVCYILLSVPNIQLAWKWYFCFITGEVLCFPSKYRLWNNIMMMMMRSSSSQTYILCLYKWNIHLLLWTTGKICKCLSTSSLLICTLCHIVHNMLIRTWFCYVLILPNFLILASSFILYIHPIPQYVHLLFTLTFWQYF